MNTCGAPVARLLPDAAAWLFATAGEIAGFRGLITTVEAKAWCVARLGREVVPVKVAAADGAGSRRLFAPADIAETIIAAPRPSPDFLRIINSFDPLPRDRKRLARLFGFDYRIEIFVPAAQRRYGYYVFALLEGDCLVGRIGYSLIASRYALSVALGHRES